MVQIRVINWLVILKKQLSYGLKLEGGKLEMNSDELIGSRRSCLLSIGESQKKKDKFNGMGTKLFTIGRRIDKKTSLSILASFAYMIRSYYGYITV